jgi:cytochrome P450
MAIDESVQRTTTPAGDPAWLVTGYDNVRALLGDSRLKRSHPEPERASRFSDSVLFGQPTGDLFSESRHHQQMRRLLGPAFSAKRMASLRARVRELLDGLLDDMAGRRPPVDLHEAVSFPLPALVICELLGVPYEDREDFRRWSAEAGRIDDAARSQAGMVALWTYMVELVERKRAQLSEDVISDLLSASEQDPEALSSDVVPEAAAGLLFAGHETTMTAIDRGVLLLLTNPAQREALQRDPAIAAQVVEEILRVPHPVSGPPESRPGGIPRWTSADIEIGGATIPAGDLVLLSVESANLDDRAFACPEAFDVTRENNPHLTFGYGPHFCMGAPLARIELQAVFGTLLGRFPTLRLAVPVEELRPRTGLLTGGIVELPVTW